jgi:hypothetical protein
MKWLLCLLVIGNIFSLNFELVNDAEKCFADEFFENTVVILEYDILDFDINQRNGTNIHNTLASKLLDAITIRITSEDKSEVVFRHLLKAKDAKISKTIEKGKSFNKA